MEKFIPYEKLSKKEKRRRDAMMRNTWGPLNPVTRKSKNPKAYDRQNSQYVFQIQYHDVFWVALIIARRFIFHAFLHSIK